MWAWFNEVDTNRSGHITALELQRALNKGAWTFDLETVKVLMTIFDTDNNGTMNFDEFSALWKDIDGWYKAFCDFDRDRSGTIDSAELNQALCHFGVRFSLRMLNHLERKYRTASMIPGGGPPPGITFDRFARMCVLIKHLKGAFAQLDTDHDDWIQVNSDQFMETVLMLL
ncbi:hypothetical protein EV715DRAFT_211466 [Schizophyllum commune]